MIPELILVLASAALVEDQPPVNGADDLPLDVPPVPVRVPTPDYPRNAIRRELSGRTVACFTVDKRGRVRNPQVVQSSNDLFSKPTLKAVRKASFKPARRGNDSVAANYCRTFRFSLEQR